MKQIVIFLIMCPLYVLGMSQTSKDTLNIERESQIDSLYSAIGLRESSLELIKKDKAKVDTLESLVEDYALLADLWREACKSEMICAEKYRKLSILLSEEDSVFLSVLPDSVLVPNSLKNHYDMICSVRDLQKDIDLIEGEIVQAAEACKAIDQDPMVIIPQKFSESLGLILDRLVEIKKSGLPTFSNRQKNYFEHALIEKYNSFEKYFTNE